MVFPMRPAFEMMMNLMKLIMKFIIKLRLLDIWDMNELFQNVIIVKNISYEKIKPSYIPKQY